MLRRHLFVAFGLAACAACSPSSSSRAPQTPPPQPGYGPYAGGPYPQQFPQQQFPPQQFPQQQPPPQQFPPQQFPPQQPQAPRPAPPPPQRPLLAPLIGQAQWQAETRNVLAEVTAHLSPQNQARVRGIPLVFDSSDPNEINAFAGCDDSGAPFLAGTVGLLDAVDAISQTKATDELFGTNTYGAYLNAVLPRITQPKGGSGALPPGIIPPQFLLDPNRLSHAHELFDDIVAFTFGHELGHHYLGHTGCANGQPMTGGPNPALLGNLVVRVLPGLNQPNEVAADGAGTISSLDTGIDRSRRGQYRWTEKGGMLLLDFFSRLEQASGISVFNPIGFIRTHPNPQLRMPIVQTVARTWYAQHPG